MMKGWVLGSHQVRAGQGYVEQQQNGGGPPGLREHILHQPPTPWVLTHSFLSPQPPSLHVGAAVKSIHSPCSEKRTTLGRRDDRVSERHTENSRSRRYWGLLREKRSQKESKDAVESFKLAGFPLYLSSFKKINTGSKLDEHENTGSLGNSGQNSALRNYGMVSYSTRL